MAIINQRNLDGERLAQKKQTQERQEIARQNADMAVAERRSAQAASQRAARIRASGQMAAAGLQASTRVTTTQRLLTEFEAGLGQRKALQQRESDRAQGQAQAGFGASGIQSVTSQADALRESNIKGNIDASQGNSQREQLLGQARQAISGALASGISASANLQASAEIGDIFKRRVATELGAAGVSRYETIRTGPDARGGGSRDRLGR
jgi:hypothetical protein